MAEMFPLLSEQHLNRLPSSAEAKVYRALRDTLSHDYTVFFQVGWILKREDDHARDGEADFMVCHSAHGYLCIEVKGGGIGFEATTGEWFSIDRHHHKHAIKNPVEQAQRAKYSIGVKLSEQSAWKQLRHGKILRGHSVFFPDIGNKRSLIRPDIPETLIGASQDLPNIGRWIDSAFEYWGKTEGSFVPIGLNGLEVMRKTFAKSFYVAPLVSLLLAEQESKRLELTKDQLRVLDFLRSRRRVAVSGGAGTGKTVLALEKARRLAAEGFNTLLTCYNRQLADHLASICAGVEGLEVMSFHQLCHRQIEKAKKVSSRDLIAEAKVTYSGQDLYDVQLPNAFAYSLDILEDRFDAIVCDEGQDFREEFWVPLELLLTDYEKSPLYVFYDDNQNIYSRNATFPIIDEPFTLTTNCRNTAPIHNAAYRFYKGFPVSPPDIDGDEIQFESAQSREAQAAKINARIVDLIVSQGVEAEDITVLVLDALRKADYYSCLKRYPLPKPTFWQEEGRRNNHSVLIETVQRFKGLESPIVILWGLDAVDLCINGELLYVGMSRAKSLMIAVGTSASCKALQML